ncbi:MAG: hypothetical protein AB7V14_12620, partial [Kiritimatiellia bacterium]
MHRKRPWLLRSSHRALIGLLGLGLTTPGAPAEIWTGTAAIEFEATSTLHDFTGTAPVEPFPVSVVQEGDFALLEGTAAVAVAQWTPAMPNGTPTCARRSRPSATR